ncbi:MAG: acyltransferase family protein, partial [Acidobacteria bacterium]|nr:acyltransferase family protein [Acidobacteriota bacterium]
MSPTPRQAGTPALPERFDAVQGLRAWSMLLVFSFHWNRILDARWPNAVSAALLSLGGWGTNLFLCVAGCFLHRSLSRRPIRYVEFLEKRFRRLYPVYAFVLTLVL